MRFMQTESVLQTKNRSRPAKNRFSVALLDRNFPPRLTGAKKCCLSPVDVKRLALLMSGYNIMI